MLYCESVLIFPHRCTEGFYSIVSEGTTCTQCPLGHMCPDAASDPIMCVQGTYSLSGQTSCTQCPLGFSCASTGVLPTPCPIGWYSAEGEASCAPCPLGHYCPVAPPAAAPIPCSIGYFSNSNESTVCEQCPPGYECSDPTRSPQPCEVGYFSGNKGSVVCKMVHIVTYCNVCQSFIVTWLCICNFM